MNLLICDPENYLNGHENPRFLTVDVLSLSLLGFEMVGVAWDGRPNLLDDNLVHGVQKLLQMFKSGSPADSQQMGIQTSVAKIFWGKFI